MAPDLMITEVCLNQHHVLERNLDSRMIFQIGIQRKPSIAQQLQKKRNVTRY